MQYPYGVTADVHCHSWSQFSSVDQDGVNSRLRVILDELTRAAVHTQRAGGDTLVIDGDLFHVRGRIEPSVFNPSFDTIESIAQAGMRVLILAGNHDLESKHSNALNNSMQKFETIHGVSVIVEPELIDDMFFIPWVEDQHQLMGIARRNAHPKHDLHIHAPLNGVIKGIPDTGIDPADLAALGYRRVFVGHYHDAREFAGGVYSIGASTHQTWSDVGTSAGFLLVGQNEVEHIPTAAPLFVDYVGGPIDPDVIKDNYVRIKMSDVEEDQIKKVRAELQTAGAKGIVDVSSRKRTVTRSTTPKANVSLEQSISDYISDHLETKLDRARIAKDALAVFAAAREAGDE